MEEIIRAGFFRTSFIDCDYAAESSTFRVGVLYSLSHPAVGNLVNDMINGQKYILNALSRTKYKEIYESQLEKNLEKKNAESKRRKLDHEPVKRTLQQPVLFYVLDLVGRGKLRRIRNVTDTDYLIRIVNL